MLNYSIADGVHATLALTDGYTTEQGAVQMPLAGNGKLRLMKYLW